MGRLYPTVSGEGGTAKRFNTYAYRVLGACVSAPPNSPAAEGCPEGTRPLYVQFSGPDRVTQYRIDGNQLEWYQPVQEPGNVFSYPGSAALLQGPELAWRCGKKELRTP